MVARLLHAGWAVAPGARFRVVSGPAVRLTVFSLTPADVEQLAEAVAAAAGAGGGPQLRLTRAAAGASRRSRCRRRRGPMAGG